MGSAAVSEAVFQMYSIDLRIPETDGIEHRSLGCLLGFKDGADLPNERAGLTC